MEEKEGVSMEGTQGRREKIPPCVPLHARGEHSRTRQGQERSGDIDFALLYSCILCWCMYTRTDNHYIALTCWFSCTDFYYTAFTSCGLVLTLTTLHSLVDLRSCTDFTTLYSLVCLRVVVLTTLHSFVGICTDTYNTH